jgi:hypothetical protein
MGDGLIVTLDTGDRTEPATITPTRTVGSTSFKISLRALTPASYGRKDGRSVVQLNLPASFVIPHTISDTRYNLAAMNRTDCAHIMIRKLTACERDVATLNPCDGS